MTNVRTYRKGAGENKPGQRSNLNRIYRSFSEKPARAAQTDDASGAPGIIAELFVIIIDVDRLSARAIGIVAARIRVVDIA